MRLSIEIPDDLALLVCPCDSGEASPDAVASFVRETLRDRVAAKIHEAAEVRLAAERAAAMAATEAEKVAAREQVSVEPE